MRALLKRQGICTPLPGSTDDMSKSYFMHQDENAHSTIIFSLVDEVSDEEIAAS